MLITVVFLAIGQSGAGLPAGTATNADVEAADDPGVPACPEGATAAVAKIDPVLKRKEPGASGHVCKGTEGQTVYEYGQFSDGTIEHETNYRDGAPTTHRTFWPDGTPRSYRSFSEGRLVVATCNGKDGSEVTCDLFPFGSSAASAAFLADSLPKNVGDEDVRFPFGLETFTRRKSLDADEGRCSGRSEWGTTNCSLRDSDDRNLHVGSFRGEHVEVDWVDTPDGQVLGQVTISTDVIETCDAMGVAYASAIELVKTRYGRAGRTNKGPLFGSKACKNYMNPDRVNYGVTGKVFRVEVDAAWSVDDGGYLVTLRYSLIPAERVSMRSGARRDAAKMYDALKKL